MIDVALRSIATGALKLIYRSNDATASDINYAHDAPIFTDVRVNVSGRFMQLIVVNDH